MKCRTNVIDKKKNKVVLAFNDIDELNKEHI